MARSELGTLTETQIFNILRVNMLRAEEVSYIFLKRLKFATN